MRDSEIDHEPPPSIQLLFPECDEMAVACGRRILEISFEFPWPCRKSQVSRNRHLSKYWLPREQRVLVRSRHGMFIHPLLAIHGSRSKQQSIVSYKLHKSIARVLYFGSLREGLFCFNHLLEGGRIGLLRECDRGDHEQYENWE